jgi:FlaA1/EpsC-like NDP-sugar epimerase
MTKRTFIFLPSRRTMMLAVIYSVIIGLSFYLAYEIRFDFAVPPDRQQERLRLIWAVIGIKLVALIWVGQLGSVMTYFSIPDLLQLIWGTSGATAVMLVPRILNLENYYPPRGVVLIDFMLCLGGLCLARLGTRLYRERISMGRKIPTGSVQMRIAIVGAGDAGATLAKEFINTPSRGFKPVLFLDDDPGKHGKLVHGVPVIGPAEALAEHKEAGTLVKAVIAMPSAPAKRVREIVLLLTGQGLKVETLPAIEELASGRVRASRIRPVEVQDLLGREAVNLDSAGIRNLITGRVVMVTGAGGSIGGELCRQIAQLNPKRLLMVEQAEGSLFIIEQELNETGLGATATPLVADILDPQRMEHIFNRYQPEIVFHAAAHKHVFLMERQPAEAIRNNVLGTRQLATISAAHGVAAFVLISTDKAINPTSVMGATKRLAEIQLMCLMAKNGHRTKFMAVRFGNVLGSSGSVIPIFKNQIAKGGPVTVTHPDVTRYFMTIPEAVGLVLQSSVLGKGGEIFVLDMGQPVKITDLARQMIELSGYKVGEDIEIKFTGLKPGEKLFEELQHRDEHHTPTEHARIMRFTAKTNFAAADLREIEEKLHELESNELKQMLSRLVPEYTPFLD